MLMHHSPEEYGAAAARAADWATNKLEKIIQSGREQAIKTIQEVRDNQPKDHVVGHAALDFKTDGKSLNVMFPGVAAPQSFHPHALVQLAERIDMPNAKKTTEWLSDPEIIEDFADIITKKYRKQEGKKYLVRSVNQQVRGFLSDRFRRLDSAPIVESFIQTITDLGALPIKGRALDTKFYLKVVLPHILEPLPGEVMLFGAQLKNSDYGDGKLDVSGFIHRLRCTNLLMTEDGFSKVHLGRRLDENIEFSQETYELDTKTMASAVRDVVRNVLAPEYVKDKVAYIKAIAEEKVDADAVIEGLRKKSKINKDEAGQLKELFSSAEVELLPPGQNQWRLSNAISLLAQRVEPERELELEALAGDVAGLQTARAA